nr:zinc ribbon domain-containing protein [Pontibacillus sp. HN14]
MSNVKKCSCGSDVSLEAKFCPSCGHEFEEIENHDVDTLEETVLLSEGKATEAPDTCPNCDEIVEKDAKFCGECGHMIET